MSKGPMKSGTTMSRVVKDNGQLIGSAVSQRKSIAAGADKQSFHLQKNVKSKFSYANENESTKYTSVSAKIVAKNGVKK